MSLNAMKKQRLSQAKLVRFLRALQALIAAVHDARVRFSGLADIRPGRLCGTSKFVKDLVALRHTVDYSAFEVQLKRRLVRASHFLSGRTVGGQHDQRFALAPRLPAVYAEVLSRYEEEARALLKALADVDLESNHQRQRTVHGLVSGI